MAYLLCELKSPKQIKLKRFCYSNCQIAFHICNILVLDAPFLSHLEHWGTTLNHIRMCLAKRESSLHKSCLCEKQRVGKPGRPKDWEQLIKYSVCPCFTGGRICGNSKSFLVICHRDGLKPREALRLGHHSPGGCREGGLPQLWCSVTFELGSLSILPQCFWDCWMKWGLGGAWPTQCTLEQLVEDLGPSSLSEAAGER